MKRIALVFSLSILLPAILLAVLAVRSLRDQELVVSSQRTQLHQASCDALTERINLFLNDLRGFYAELVDTEVRERGDDAEGDFHQFLESRWGQATAGVVVSGNGSIIPDHATPGSRLAGFLEDHTDFLTNRRVVEVYQVPRLRGAQMELETVPETTAQDTAVGSVSTNLAKEGAAKWRVGITDKKSDQDSLKPTLSEAPKAMAPVTSAPEGNAPRASAPGASAPATDSREKFAFDFPAEEPASPVLKTRNVTPMQERGQAAEDRDERQDSVPAAVANYSAISPESVRLEQVTSEESEGAVSRIIDGQLHVLLWKRHPLKPGLTFWAELDLTSIRADLAKLFSAESLSATAEEVSLALLDARGEPVAQTATGFATDWSKPFVAAEVGPILPRWEVAAYLLDPTSLDSSARTVRLTLWLVTLTLLAAVAGGSFLILRSVNYEMRIAAQKTDFVSNVSHELKTPLTSIRMFSELLRDSESPDPDKTRQYSGVISRESARLTRLINRLLDFSRLDRGELQWNQGRLDLSQLAAETIEDYRPQLEAVGLEVRLIIPEQDGPSVLGDRDALSQVLLNLLSNAEKYAATGGLVSVEIGTSSNGRAFLHVKDRGPGIPRAHQRRIFEKFYRVDDSITSGIEGSGIGLALSRQMVELHGGTIRYETGREGGSHFIIELPLTS
ncbi:MAG: HAMP domain-containing histidine kinase [Verrucomicrobiales bacterium]|nr:HAMP domain-containing histidine kinase [Verrucomicrobiales bacterium]